MNFPSRKKIILAFILIQLLALPIILFAVKKQQETRSRADLSTDISANTAKLLSDKGNEVEQISTSLQRKEQMKNLGRENPDQFLLNVITEDIKITLPSTAQENIERKVEVEGMLYENVIEENNNPDLISPPSFVLQEIDSEGESTKTYEIYFRQEQAPEHEGRIKLKGYLLDNIIVPTSIEQLSEPQAFSNIIDPKSKVLGVNTTGAVRIAVIMVNFKDDDSDVKDDFTQASLYQIYFTHPDYSVAKYIENSSLGKLDVIGDQSDVYGWLDLKGYTRKQVCDINEKNPDNRGFKKAINKMARAEAAARGKNFDEYDIIGYIFTAVKEETANSDKTNCYWNAIAKGIPGDSDVEPVHFLNGDYDGINDYNHGPLTSTSAIKFYSGILAHEVSHNLGLSHAHGMSCGSKQIAAYSDCTIYNYGDRFDMIGGAWDYHSHTNAKNKLMQNWIPQANMRTVKNDMEVTLYSASKERAGQTQLIKIDRPTDGGNYYLEYRSKNNGDGGGPAGLYRGALLRLSDVNLPPMKNEYGKTQDEWRTKQTYLIDVDKEDSSARGGLLNPAFKDGLTFEDKRNKIIIKQISHDAESVRLSITLGPPPCERNHPSMIFTEPSLSGKAGETIRYEAKITNNNSATCSQGNFVLSSDLPSGWNIKFSDNEIPLSPEQQKTVFIDITSAASANADSNPHSIQITVKNKANPEFTKTKEAKYSIEKPVTPTESPTPTPTVVPPTQPPAYVPRGNFDGSSCSVSTGWTCDANNFGRAIDVHFYADGPAGTGTLIGSTTANGAREAAVGSICGGNSSHGFSFNTPQSLKDGRAHPIYAYAINIGPSGPNPLLSGSPKTITCANPTVVPTVAPTSTPTPSPDTTLRFTSLKLHGIGKGGDNVNPNGTGNSNPLNPTRSLTVELYNASGTLITSAVGNIAYSAATGDFTGTIKLPSTINSGGYLVKIKSSQFLRRQLPGVVNIVKGTTNQGSGVSLVTGDINGDQKLTFLDFGILKGCYSDLLPARDCTPAKKAASDITNDGKVNQDDFSLYIRELSVIAGD